MSSPESFPAVCAWCERARNEDGGWEPIADQAPDPHQATHGICPECLDRETRAAVAYGAFGPPDLP